MKNDHFLRPVLLLALFAAASSYAQTGPAPGVDDLMGMIAYQAYHGGDIDSISLSTGSLALHSPLVSFPQRGGALKEDYAIYYNNNPYHLVLRCPADSGCELDWTKSSNAVGAYVADSQTPQITVSRVVVNSRLQQYDCFYSVQEADASKHRLGQITGSVNCNSSNGTTYEALDGSGYHLTIDASGNYTITDASGIRYYLSSSSTVWKEDPNGNQILRSNTGDTLGRQMPNSTSTSDFSNCPQGGTLLPVSAAAVWSPPGYNAGTFTVKYCYASVALNYPGDSSSGVVSFSGNVQMLQSIVLPNGTAWSFEYNDNDNSYSPPLQYGNLTKLTLPTGGTISYAYVNSGVLSTNFTRRVSSRTVNSNDGTGSHTWTYSWTVSGSDVSSVTVTDPLGSDTVHSFTSLGVHSSYETTTQYYQGAHSANQLLKTVGTQYISIQSAGFGNSAVNVFPTTITTTWPSTQVSKITKSYDSGFTYTDMTSSATVHYGKVVSQSDYDYGTNAAGPLLRTTNTSYAWQSPNPNYSSYLSNNLLNLVASVQICSPVQSGETADCGTLKQRSNTTYAHDENTPSSSGVTLQHDANPPAGTYRGNQTSSQRWLSSGTLTCPDGSSGGSNSYVKSKTTFFDTGTINTASDPCSHSTSYVYSSTYYGAYPTTITNALSQSTTKVYDFNTGVLTSTTDPNQLSTTYNYDTMWRLSQVTHPDNGQDSITRQETTFPFTATLTSKINSSLSKVRTNVFDGFGRITQTKLTSDPQGTVYTDTAYDALGRVGSVSNPYRTAPDPTSSPGTTTYTYDALGRKTQETYADSSVLTTAYCGPNTLVTDPTGKWRRSRVDGLGRLVEVDEPNSTTASVASTGCPGTSEPIWVTSYTLDALSNLTKVVQNSSRTRTFTYDTLSRLLTSNNPENGTLTYTYNPDGTVLTKQDARSITANYVYDKLHRETSVTYSNGDPSLTFTYDETNCLGLAACQNIGYRTSMTDGGGSEKWAYQVDSTNYRSIHKEQRTNNSSPSNITKTTTYYLDLAGNVTQLVYPTGRTVNYTYDAADRPSTAADSANGITYATDWKTPGTGCLANAVCYTPQGNVYNMSIGQTSSFNGFNTSETFNNRLQPNEIKASSSAGNAIDITYNFVDPTSGKNAAHVYGVTNNLNSSRSQAFTYDQLNRITSAGTTATTGTYCWGYQYTYDTWGNLLSQSAWTPTYNTCTESNMAGVTADGNNHITGLSYDSSGNTLGDGIYTYTWDGENQLKTAGGVTYTYDGDGHRAAKVGSKLYWYGSGGEILVEADASGNTQNEYIFFGGKRVAMVPASGSALYYAEDLLGSSRVIVQSNGTLCYDADFTPFGSERSYTSNCTQNYKFEGKERDTETANDDFGARYYTWRFGRWLSSDWSAVPVPVPYANLINPQTLNLYAIVTDDPESFADLDGHNKGEPSLLQFLEDQIEDVTQEAVDTVVKPLVESATAVEPTAEVAASDIAGVAIGVLYLGSPGTTLTEDKDTTRKYDEKNSEKEHSAEPKPAADGAGAGKGKKPHGNTAGNQYAERYEKRDKNGNLLKHGVSQNAAKRYTKKQLGSDQIVVKNTGTRRQMLQEERHQVETNPGPQNHERWAGSQSNDPQ